MDYEAELIARLNELSPRARSAFAVSCAERLYPLYLRFEPTVLRLRRRAFEGGSALRRALDLTWDAITEEESVLRIAAEAAALKRLAAYADVEEDEGATAEDLVASGHVEGAITAALYAMESLERGSDLKLCFWPADISINSLGELVRARIEAKEGRHPDYRQVFADRGLMALLSDIREDLLTLRQFKMTNSTAALLRVRAAKMGLFEYLRE
jgi:hypothetical protein